MNINLINIYNDPNFIYCKTFGLNIINQIIDSYFNNSIKYLYNSDFKLSLQYSSFFDKYNINHPFISFIYIYIIFNIYNNNINKEYINKIIKHYIICKNINNFYNIKELNNYINNYIN